MAAAVTIRSQAPLGEALVDLGIRRPEVMVLAADLARYVEVLPFAERFPERFLQMGMSEQNAVGVAAGLAKSDLRPILVTYGVFITRRAYDQVAMALATGGPPVVLVGFMPGITTPFRATHQSIDDLALMRALPGMSVVDPADRGELAAAIEAGIDGEGPLYIRAFRGAQPPLPLPAGEGFALGRALELLQGGPVAFIGTGLGTQWALESAAVLEAQGVKSALLHVPSLKPLDVDAVLDFCRAKGTVICVENHTVVGGLHSAVAAAVASEGLGARVLSAAVPDRWPPAGSTDHIRKELGLDPEGLARRALAEVQS
jgi:transketolase